MRRLLDGTRAGAVAWVAAATNLVAAVCLATVLRPGLPRPSTSALERSEYIRTHLFAWRLGWFAWHLAALALLALFVVLALRVRRAVPVIAVLAVACASAGLAADLAAEAALMALVPSATGSTFVELERASLLLTGYVANGLYSLAGALLTAAIWRELPRPLRALALVVWPAGFVLSAATLADSVTWEIAATAVVMPAFVVFAGGLGAWLRDS